jgi:multiple sugar transport system permease protein
MKSRMWKLPKTILVYLVVILIVAACVVPVLWILLTAVKEQADIFAMPPKLFFRPTMANFVDIFANRNFLHYLVNSVVLAVSTTLLAVVLGVVAAYGFSRYNFKGKKDIFFWILSVRMSPAIVAVIPLFLIIARIGLLDNLISVTVVYLLINLPFIIWVVKGFIDEVPIELDEAARIDGCSSLRTLVRIIVPVISPGIAATAILSIIFSWNEFLFALVLTGINARTLPVTILQFITLTGINWGPMCAAGTVTIFPIFIFALSVQKHLVRGLTLGAVK